MPHTSRPQLAQVVERLLGQAESATLEFKRSWYDLNHADQKVRRYQRDELIKDILALANGSATTAGEMAYLIIGAEDTLSVDGSRRLYSLSGVLPSRRDLLDKVNSVCAPALEDLQCDEVVVSGNRLFVIRIPASPHLHETTVELIPGGKLYQKHVVFIREHEHIEVADDRERNTIRRMKALHLEHTLQAPARRFGMVVGAVVGGITWAAVTDKPIVANAQGPAAYLNYLPGSLIGGLAGLLLGQSYRGLKYTAYELPKIPLPWRYLVPTSMVLFIRLAEILLKRISVSLVKPKSS